MAPHLNVPPLPVPGAAPPAVEDDDPRADDRAGAPSPNEMSDDTEYPSSGDDSNKDDDMKICAVEDDNDTKLNAVDDVTTDPVVDADDLPGVPEEDAPEGMELPPAAAGEPPKKKQKKKANKTINQEKKAAKAVWMEANVGAVKGDKKITIAKLKNWIDSNGYKMGETIKRDELIEKVLELFFDGKCDKREGKCGNFKL